MYLTYKTFTYKQITLYNNSQLNKIIIFRETRTKTSVNLESMQINSRNVVKVINGLIAMNLCFQVIESSPSIWYKFRPYHNFIKVTIIAAVDVVRFADSSYNVLQGCEHDTL